MFLTLYSNQKGQILEHPEFEMLGRSGNQWVVPDRYNMIPLPKGAALVSLPNQIPVGIANGSLKGLDSDPLHPGRQVNAVAALLPQGFTRTLLPSGVNIKPDQVLPLYGYAAIGLKGDQIYVAAIKTDKHHKWHPAHYNTNRLPVRINKMVKKYPENRILKQLVHCSLEYGCYTAQNLFYQRWEAGIPTSNVCNASCIGCISQSHHPSLNSPQNRLTIKPELKEIVELGIEHLNKANDGIISFGQGCEGEPSLNDGLLAQAIRQIRDETGKGTININTNAGYSHGIKQLCRAGLDTMRVTVFSFNRQNYRRYHNPRGYDLSDVIKSIVYARESNTRVDLNLLTFPGFTDREEEIDYLFDFLSHHPWIHMIQFRNLNIDPDFFVKHFNSDNSGIGIDRLISLIQKEFPNTKIGSYTHPVKKG
ncbi:MAG: radical SAM protein [Syntrophomonadaceae bacterium]|jgi:pyruvate-formate lyase-activating enzyme